MEWKKIESRQNPAVKFAASLADKKIRDREGVFAAEGITLFFDFCGKGLFPKAIYLSEEALPLKEKIDAQKGASGAERFLLSASAFEKVTEEKGSQGILCLYSLADLSKLFAKKAGRRFVALENVQDPGNVGTIIRTAASFGFDGVFLVRGADPFSNKAIRASMGAIASIPIQIFSCVEALFSHLKEAEIKTIAAALSEGAVSIEKADLSEPVCILIGNEGKGLSSFAIENADSVSIIPIENTESLNAAAAATVFLWEVKRRGGKNERK
jgi:TrmH family RNA methyltransferase